MIIQKIKAWRYPCEKKCFYFENRRMFSAQNTWLVQTRKHLTDINPTCSCGKKCSPQKVEIIMKEML